MVNKPNIRFLDIINIITKYYFICKILKFSTKYKSDDGLQSIDNNKCVIRVQGSALYKWILCYTKPVEKGIHCWRIKVTLIKLYFNR